MADSVTISFGAQITKNGDTLQDSASLTYTPASVFKGEGVSLTVTNSWVAIAFGGATTVRRFWIKNLDASISIDIAVDNAGAKIFATVLAGEFLPPLPTKSGQTYYWKTSSGTCTAAIGFDGAS